MFWNFFDWVIFLFTKKPTVERILRGSHNLDKMRQELKELPALLISLLNDFHKSRPDCSPFNVNSPPWFDLTDRHEGRWYWQLTQHNQVVTGITLWCSQRQVFVYQAGSQLKLDVTSTQEVHETGDVSPARCAKELR